MKTFKNQRNIKTFKSHKKTIKRNKRNKTVNNRVKNGSGRRIKKVNCSPKPKDELTSSVAIQTNHLFN